MRILYRQIITLAIILFIVFPSISHAGAVWRVTLPEETKTDVEDTNEQGFWGSLTRWLQGRLQIIRPEIGTTFVVESTAYTPSPYQTDDTPCITAAGTRVRPGVVASNFLPLGTLLKIKETPTNSYSFNQTTFIVEDRMNPRFQQRMLDLWFPDRATALKFGRRHLTIEIIGYGTPGQSLENENQEELIETSIIKRANLRFLASARSISRLLVAAVGQSHDVDCFSTE
jgi:3D (Asp-Asp-Asp) domain-containing protein